MAKRFISDLSESEASMDLEATISEEPSSKRMRYNHNGNHNHNHNHNHNNIREHPHYQKFANSLQLINPFTSIDFRTSIDLDDDNDDDDNDDDCVITRVSTDFYSRGCYDCNTKDREIKKKNKDITELKTKLTLLKNITTSKREPNYTRFPMDKYNGISTRGLGIIKQRLMKIYDKKNINVVIKKAEHKKYKPAIRAFLKKNKNAINQTNNQTKQIIAISINNSNNN
eukprot:218948_1